jgi:hypothetical protein
MPEWMPEFAPPVELRLQTVAEDVHSLEAKRRDFSEVVGALVLAGLSS